MNAQQFHQALLSIALGLCAIAASGPEAAAAPPTHQPFAALQPLPVDAQTAWGRKVAAQRSEAMHEAARYARPDLGQSTLQWAAANYAALGKPNWEIVHQDITVDLNVKAAELYTELTVTVRAHQPTDTFALLTSALSKTLVTGADGAEVKVKVESISNYTGITVSLPQPLVPETDLVLHLSGTAKLSCGPEGIGLVGCGLGSTYQWVTFYRYYLTPQTTHGPFTSDLHVVTDAKKIAIAPGSANGSDTLPDGRVVWHFKQIERTDNAGFAIADYVVTKATIGDKIPLNVFTTAKYGPTAKSTAKMIGEVIADYGAKYVPFQWAGLNVIQLENNFGGGYSPLSGIFMYRDVFGADPNSQGWWVSSVELTAHEVAHQWWGNLVEPWSNGDVSLSESLAEFSSCVYTEKLFESRSQFLQDNLSYLYQVQSNQDLPLGAQNVYGTPAYVEIVYHKGAAVFDMLRNEIGGDVVSAVLKQYATEYNRDFASVDDLRKVAEKVSGKDLGYFWDQWFNKKGAIKLEAAGRLIETDGKLVFRLKIHQLQPKPFKFTLPLTIDTADGKSVVVPVLIDPKGDPTTIVEVPVASRPVRVRMDIQRNLVRQFATGTPGDFNLSGLVDGADLVELALRYGRAMRITGKNGAEHYYADTSWNELYDLKADWRVNDADIEELSQWVGATAEEF